MTSIAENLKKIYQQIAEAEAKRDAEEGAGKAAAGSGKTALIAVAKTHPLALIREAYDAGQRDFGENYVQEALAKIEELKQQGLNDINWHFIGHLQSNKARIAAESFAWVQTVDSLKLARRLNEFRSDSTPPLNITIQTNTSGEASKSGLMPQDLADFCAQLKEFPRLNVRGIMTIPEPTDDIAKQREDCSRVREIFTQLKQQLGSDFPNWDTLSMGMTQDMEVAILEGSSMVRIGTAIFGQRK